MSTARFFMNHESRIGVPGTVIPGGNVPGINELYPVYISWFSSISDGEPIESAILTSVPPSNGPTIHRSMSPSSHRNVFLPGEVYKNPGVPLMQTDSGSWSINSRNSTSRSSENALYIWFDAFKETKYPSWDLFTNTSDILFTSSSPFTKVAE